MSKASRSVCQLYAKLFQQSQQWEPFIRGSSAVGCPAKAGVVLHRELNLPIVALRAAVDWTCHIYARNVIKNWKN